MARRFINTIQISFFFSFESDYSEIKNKLSQVSVALIHDIKFKESTSIFVSFFGPLSGIIDIKIDCNLPIHSLTTHGVIITHQKSPILFILPQLVSKQCNRKQMKI